MNGSSNHSARSHKNWIQISSLAACFTSLADRRLCVLPTLYVTYDAVVFICSWYRNKGSNSRRTGQVLAAFGNWLIFRGNPQRCLQSELSARKQPACPNFQRPRDGRHSVPHIKQPTPSPLQAMQSPWHSMQIRHWNRAQGSTAQAHIRAIPVQYQRQVKITHV
jgi:hypothetical protein